MLEFAAAAQTRLQKVQRAWWKTSQVPCRVATFVNQFDRTPQGERELDNGEDFRLSVCLLTDARHGRDVEACIDLETVGETWQALARLEMEQPNGGQKPIWRENTAAATDEPPFAEAVQLLEALVKRLEEAANLGSR